MTNRIGKLKCKAYLDKSNECQHATEDEQNRTYQQPLKIRHLSCNELLSVLYVAAVWHEFIVSSTFL